MAQKYTWWPAITWKAIIDSMSTGPAENQCKIMNWAYILNPPFSSSTYWLFTGMHLKPALG